MNQYKFKKLSRTKGRPKELFVWRNKAVKYFNLKKGEIIHHLRETKEQQEFNDAHYERWGFDFDGVMKYCIKMTKDDHIKIHFCDDIKRKKVSENNARAFKGKKHSEENIKKWSENRMGEKNPMFGKFKARPWSRQVKCIETGEIFEYVADAARKLKISGSTIISSCNRSHLKSRFKEGRLHFIWM